MLAERDEPHRSWWREEKMTSLIWNGSTSCSPPRMPIRARWRALVRNVSGSRRQGRAAAVGSVKGRSPAPTGVGKMRRKRASGKADGNTANPRGAGSLDRGQRKSAILNEPRSAAPEAPWRGEWANNHPEKTGL